MCCESVVAVCCSVWQWYAVSGSECTQGGNDAAQDILQCVVAVRSSVLQCVKVYSSVFCGVLHNIIAVHCSALQRDAVCGTECTYAYIQKRPKYAYI